MKFTPGVNFINILRTFVTKFVQSQTLSREKLLKILLYQKCLRKMLMILTPGVNNTVFFKLFSIPRIFRVNMNKNQNLHKKYLHETYTRFWKNYHYRPKHWFVSLFNRYTRNNPRAFFSDVFKSLTITMGKLKKIFS